MYEHLLVNVIAVTVQTQGLPDMRWGIFRKACRICGGKPCALDLLWHGSSNISSVKGSSYHATSEVKT